jgi:hypothetical protein
MAQRSTHQTFCNSREVLFSECGPAPSCGFPLTDNPVSRDGANLGCTLQTVLPPIDSKVWRAYGWRNLDRLASLPRVPPACGVWHDSWPVNALDSKVAEAPK